MESVENKLNHFNSFQSEMYQKDLLIKEWSRKVSAIENNCDLMLLFSFLVPVHSEGNSFFHSLFLTMSSDALVLLSVFLPLYSIPPEANM